MEFFVCPCNATGNVILDGNDQGPNKDSSEELLTKQCNTGQHTIKLVCPDGMTCTPKEVTVVVKNTDPIAPKEVSFLCA